MLILCWLLILNVSHDGIFIAWFLCEAEGVLFNCDIY